ncbi:MAG: hypothetical protein HZB39_19135 [Planctomycetes bacterium]|nr:hypothetical protein [Planctomycetota bacterium]
MFDRFVRLAQARRALRAGHYEEALRLVDDPLVAGQRRAEELRVEILAGFAARAKRRIDAGALSAARVDVEKVLARQPDDELALDLRTRLKDQVATGDDRRGSQIALLRDARRAIDAADLDAAAALCRSAAALGASPDLDRVTGLLSAARQRVADLLGEADVAARDGRLVDAADALARARTLDRGDAAVDTAVRRFVREHGAALARAVKGLGAGSGPTLARLHERLPELSGDPAIESLGRACAATRQERVLHALAADELETARVACRELGGDPEGDRLRELCALLERAHTALERGDPAVAAAAYAELAEATSAPTLAARARTVAELAAASDAGLERARAHAHEGRLADARDSLVQVLSLCDGHERARAELDALDRGVLDREKRLSDARALVRDGKLQEAGGLVVALAVPGQEGEEPRLLMREIRQRRETADAGVRQVAVRMHDRRSGGREGLEQCARKVAELQKVQADHVELLRMRDAIAAELRGLALCERIRGALDAGQFAEVEDGLVALAALRGELLGPDRLDARALELVDDALATAERAVSSGQVSRAERLERAIASWEALAPGLARRREAIRSAVESAASRARALVEQAASALSADELARAEELRDAALALASDDPAVMRAAADIARVRREDDRLAAAARHADAKDFGAAHRELGRLGPTPAPLRTRVFDLKRAIAKAQGLDGAFLLRIDEGGEFLVVRGESLTIGNLRDGSADLPLLANLAGRHARLRRSMSFHGGQQDTIVAEGGELFRDGKRVADLRLQGRVRFRLGPTVEMEYRMPSSRSLSANLSILGGFVVAGTDRVIWMKDRGRDGRILIGPGRDAHVVVAGLQQEIEVFADRDGRIRVAVPGSATMDGRPFTGDHPVAAGASIAVGDVSLVMVPWQRA